MPVEGAPLVIEPSYPMARELMNIVPAPEADTGADKGITIRNCFWSHRKNGRVYVFEDGGKVKFAVDQEPPHSLELALGSLSCADAWGIEQEHKAVQLLGTLLRHRQLKQYLMTGMFVEKSKRSGIHYIFRRLRPTVAFTMNGNVHARERGDDGQMKILCALCMHPIAYYRQSWGGAMCPTDDVVAMLALMRGDEHMLWKRANQHPAWAREAGL